MKPRFLSAVTVLTVLFILSACKTPEEIDLNYPIDRVTIPQCEIESTHVGDLIQPINVVVPDADVHGHIDQFINACKTVDTAPLVVSGSTRPTYRLTFEMPGNYPISHIEITNFIGDDALKLEKVHVEISESGRTFRRVHNDIALEDITNIEIDQNAAYVRLIFSSEEGVGNQSGPFFGLHDVRFYLGEGFMIERSPYFTDPFFRMQGWTGADGIFSYNLTGDYSRHIGVPSDDVLFIFSDTFIGGVYPHNLLRHSEIIVNNTLAYYDTSQPFAEGIEFYYAVGDNDRATSVFTPEYFIGYQPANLINGDGLSIFPYQNAILSERALGHGWRASPEENRITLDFKNSVFIEELVLYNDHQNSEYGIKNFNLYAGDQLNDMTLIGNYQLPKMIDPLEGPQKTVSLSLTAQFIEIEIIDNHESVATVYGLGKILPFDAEGRFIHADVTASGFLDDKDALENSGILWLQDSVIIDGYLYNFPILVKDNVETEFKVHKVGLSKTPIINNRLDYAQTVYFDSPFQVRTDDGGEIFYGAGILDMSNHPDVIDPYIYIYGYKDLDGRRLTVARVLPEDIEDFNAYEYFDGEVFQSDIRQSYAGLNGVSAELSVTYIPSGQYQGKYMLVSMKDTITNLVVYSISETPYGPFSDFVTIYVAPEPYQLDYAFTYNAKMHPVLSEEGKFVISYNVNGTRVMALKNARVYYPRFITMTEVRSNSND